MRDRRSRCSRLTGKSWWLIAVACFTTVAAQSSLDPRSLCSRSLKFYQFINYDAIYGTGGRLCYRVERAEGYGGRSECMQNAS